MLTVFVCSLLVAQGFGRSTQHFAGDVDDVQPLLNVDNGIWSQAEASRLNTSCILSSYANGSPISGLAESREDPNQALIINGADATPGNQKYMVSLQVVVDGKSQHICGGSLVSPTQVLTAAHCLPYWGVYTHQVALGYNQISLGTDNPGSQLVPISSVERHEDYEYNDIALISLSRPAQLTDTVQPASLTTQMPDGVEGEAVTLTGWGTTDGMESGDAADILQLAEFTIVSKNECANAFGDVHIHPFHLCVKDYPQSGCMGDSGGPLTLASGGKQVGVVSFGSYTCQTELPSVYTSVGFFSDWINSRLQS